MAKIPERPEEVFGDFVHDYKKVLGDDLKSVILYGSAARGDYVPKKSDINFMLVVSQSGIGDLGRVLLLVPKWHRRRVATPLFLTREYIVSSLDTFPVEFLGFKSAYRLVFGEDVLRDLTFDLTFVRLQCERELKGKLLQLRERFLETEGKKHSIVSLISSSIPTFLTLFQALLYLQGKEPCSDTHVLIQQVAREARLDETVFAALWEIKQGIVKLEGKEAVPLMERYIEQVRKLSVYADGIGRGA